MMDTDNFVCFFFDGMSYYKKRVFLDGRLPCNITKGKRTRMILLKPEK
jgi:hypothetical protein